MNCLHDLLHPRRCRRRHSTDNLTSLAKQQQQQQQQKEQQPTTGTSLFSRRTRQRRQSENLTKAFFDLVDVEKTTTADDSSTLRLEEEQSLANVNCKLGNIRKKEIITSQQQKNKYAYMSNHVVVNQEREQRGIPLLTRCSILDEMAKGKAQEMANSCKVLMAYTSETMVENVHRTPSLQLMHQLVMHGIDNTARDHILNPRFLRFGMGTARGQDGMIYVSQLFQGTTVTTTTTTTTTTTSNQDAPMKNPRTRLVPTIDIPVDPAILQNKKHQHRHNQRREAGNRASHKRSIAVE